MEIAKKAAACLVLAAIATTVLAAPLQRVQGAPNELDQKLQERDQLLKEIEDLKKRIDSTKKTENSVMAELRRLEDQLALATRELDYIELQMSLTNEKIQETETEISNIQAKLDSQKAAFNARLVSMYKSARVSYAAVLLSSKSLSEFMAKLHYLRQIAVEDNTLISTYASQCAALAAKRQELDQEIRSLADLKASEEQKRASVASRSQDRERYLAQVQADRKSLEEALDQMERESEALNKVIADLQAKGQKPQTHKLQMIWPVTGGWISSEYGNRLHPILGYYRWHSGIDYAVDYGTPIKAAEDGTVIFADSNGGYGNCVIIDHGGGVSTLYAHASKILVKVGQDVLKGQTIALVGSTGLSTGPHLHFEVRVNGETQDPLKWLP